MSWANRIDRCGGSLKVKFVGRSKIIVSTVGVFLLGACSVTEQTPDEVGQKFEQGIKGQGKIVPIDQDQSQTEPSNNAPANPPAGFSR